MYLKKFISCILSSLLLVGSCISINANASNSECPDFNGTNINQNTYGNYTHPNYSYLTKSIDGRLMSFQAMFYQKKYVIQYYDNNYNRTGYKTLNYELPIYGGFYQLGNYYYIISGQENPQESSSVECFRLTKYDKNWNKVKSCSVKNCNTRIPFNLGKCSFTSTGNYLIVHTSHQIYKINGIAHQANITMEFNISNMTLSDISSNVSNPKSGFVTHSFNQFAKLSDGKLFTVDQGDASDRAVTLIRYPSTPSNGKFKADNQCTYTDVFKFQGKDGENYTGANIGGFEISDSSYLVAGASVKQDSNFRNRKTKNVFITVTPKTYSGKFSSSQTKWITSYSEGSTTASNPYLIYIGNEKFMVLWSVNTDVYYCNIDGKGKKLTDIYKMDGQLSDCTPIVYNGKVLWYTWQDTRLRFYSINISNLNDTKITEKHYGHNLNFVSKSGQTVTTKCSTCGKIIKKTLPKTTEILWKDSTTKNNYAYSTYKKEFKRGDKFLLYVCENGSTSQNSLNNINVQISDTSVMSYYPKDGWINGLYGDFKIKKNGRVTVKIWYEYDPSFCKTYTVNIGHWYNVTRVAPTCDKQGYEIHKCQNCGYSYKSVLSSDIAHSVSNWKTVSQPTCQRNGVKTGKCTKCGRFVTQVIPASSKYHHYSTKIINPTCSAQGYTLHKCTECGYSYKDNYKNKINHTYKTTVVNPTYAAEGYTLHKCSKCGYSYTSNKKAMLRLPGVTNLRACAVGNKVLLTWNRVSQADSYGIYKYDSSSGMYIKFKSVRSNTVDITNLSHNKTYRFGIKAETSINSSQLITVSVKTK